MQLINTILLAAAALASMATAENIVHFVNQDHYHTKNIVFTPNAGIAAISTLVIGPAETQTQTFPDGWLGNFYSYTTGLDNVPGMLGEVAFGGFAGATYYDVSSIVNAGDSWGVKVLYPAPESFASLAVSEFVSLATSAAEISGCLIDDNGCTNRYNAPDDKATKSTTSTSLICIVGNPLPANWRRSARFAREYVRGITA